MKRLLFEFDFSGSLCYPTAQGRSLCLTPGDDWIRSEVTLSFAHREKDEDDTLLLQLFLADTEGVVWTASRFLSAHYLFLEAFFSRNGLSEADPATDQGDFESRLILEGVRCYDDSRVWVHLAVRRQSGVWELEKTPFKHKAISFDVAARPRTLASGEVYEHSLDLRFQGWSFGLENEPALVCTDFPIFRLFHMAGFYYVEGVGYTDAELPLPNPLVFEPTEERSEPQESVVAVSEPPRLKS